MMVNNYVYFLRNPATNEIKIGRSKNPYARQKEIESDVGHPLELLLIVENEDFERTWHKEFRGHRTHGEWFAPHPDLLKFISDIQHLRVRENDKREDQTHTFLAVCVMLSDIAIIIGITTGFWGTDIPGWTALLMFGGIAVVSLWVYLMWPKSKSQ